MKLFYRKAGEGRPLVFLHGLFGSGDNWLTLAGKLKGFEVWLPDLRNHGGSPWSQDFSVQDLADDLRDFLDDHGLEKAVIGGHSLGGKVAMEFALSYPERTKGLLVVDMAPRAYEPRYDGFVQALLSVDLDTVHSRSDAQHQLSPAIQDKATMQFLLKNLVLSDHGTGWSWRLNLSALQLHYDEIWLPLGVTGDGGTPRSFRGPSLFLSGGNSDYVRTEDEPMILSLFPVAEREEVPGAGHWLHAEKPSEVLTIFRNWLGRNGLGGHLVDGSL